ncbi:MAG: M20 family metallopeptidase [Thermodesulfobacteriota bacterium]
MDPEALDRAVARWRDRILGWRRDIHRHPELGLDCRRTAGLIARELEAWGLEVTTGLAETGLAAVLRGDRPGPVVGLRVDLDALPLVEETGLEFASAVNGVMHACGHDGHAAIGLGAAAVLSEFKAHLNGTVKFIFQPGEETGQGAERLIEDGVLENPPVAALLGFHLHPMLPAGSLGVCCGTVTAGDLEFQITLEGQGGHAARPHETRDPIAAAGYLLTALQTVASRRVDPLDPVVVTVGQINGGSGFNVIPEKVVLKGTARYLSPAGRAAARQEMDEILRGLETGFGVEAELEFFGQCPPLVVDEDLCTFLEGTARRGLAAVEVHRLVRPSMGSEDFAFFARKVPCGYFRLGCRDEARGLVHPLHHPRFDFDEDLLSLGVRAAALFLSELLDYPGHEPAKRPDPGR